MSKRQKELFSEFVTDREYVSDIPELAKEWNVRKNHGKFPEDYLSQSNKKVWWVCSEGHEWQAAIYSRSSGRGCPYCAGKLPSKTYNLKYNFPSIAAEWHEKN